jgi:hypothetical protein
MHMCTVPYTDIPDIGRKAPNTYGLDLFLTQTLPMDLTLPCSIVLRLPVKSCVCAQPPENPNLVN